MRMDRRHHLIWVALVAVAGAPRTQADLAAAADVLLESRLPATDDPDALAARLLAAAGDHARSPVAELLVESAGRMVPTSDDPRAIADGLTAFLRIEEAHGGARHAAEVLLRQILTTLGDPAANEVEPYRAFARRWLAIGPFGDDGDFYDGVPFPPELRFPAPGEQLPGRFGPVTPRVVARRAHERDVDLGPADSDARGCNYGLHQVTADAPTSCYVEVASRGSFELFVNGERVRGVDRVRERTTPVVHVPVALRAGVNHVLVKTTLEDRHEVGLRYVDARGRPVAGLEELAPDRIHALAPATAGGPPPLSPFVGPLDALVQAARRSDGAGTAALSAAIARLGFELGAPEVGNEFLLRLAQSPPTEPRLLLALSEAWRLAPDAPTAIRDGESRRLLEAALDGLDGHHHATMRHADLMRGDDRIEDAVRLVRSAMADGANGCATHAKLVDLLDALEADAQVQIAREEWLKAHPLDATPRRALALERGRNGDPAGALALLEAGLERLPGHKTLLAHARSLAVDLGQRDKALEFVERIHAEDPEALAARRSRAEVLRELGDVAGSNALWRECAAHPDADAELLQVAGMALWAGGDREAATRVLERSAAREPSQHALRRMLDRLAGAVVDHPRMARFRRSAEAIDAMIAEFEPSDRERGAPSTMLLDAMIVEFLPDGGHVQEVHQLRRINDLRGVEAHEEAQAAAGADEVVRLRTIGTDGASYVPTRVGGTFAMPRVEPGAFIEEVWRERHDAPGAEPWRGPSFLFRGEDEPFLHSELVLILPPGHPGSVRLRGFRAEPERVELEDGYVALRYVMQDVPRLRPERLTPPVEELVPIVAYGEDRTAGAARRYAAAAAASRTRITPWVEQAAAKVVDGVEGDVARARAVHRWVHETIAIERGAADPTEILLQRQGPRFFLEVAMLRAAGLKVTDAVAMDENEAMTAAAPSLFAGDESYEVPAALVEPRDGERFWLFVDLPRHAPLGFVSASRAGAAAMTTDGRVVRLPAASEGAPGWDVAGELTFTPDGDADLDVQLGLRDAPGYGLAQQVRDLDANRRGVVARSLGAQLFEGWTLRGAELDAPDAGQRFAAGLQLRRRGALQPAGDLLQLALPLPPSSMFQRYGDSGTRELPLRQTGATLEEWSVLIRPGDAHELAAVPPDLRITHPMLDYELTYRRDGDDLRVHRRVALRPGTLPAARFPEWTHLLRKIDRAEEARISFLRAAY